MKISRFKPKTTMSVIPNDCVTFNAEMFQQQNFPILCFSNNEFLGSNVNIFTNQQKQFTQLGCSNISNSQTSMSAGSYFVPDKVNISNSTLGYFITANDAIIKLENTTSQNSIGIMIVPQANSVSIGIGFEEEYDNLDKIVEVPSTTQYRFIVITNIDSLDEYGYSGKTYLIFRQSSNSLAILEFPYATSRILCFSNTATVENAFYIQNELIQPSIPEFSDFMSLFLIGDEIGKRKINDFYVEFRQKAFESDIVIDGATFDLNFSLTSNGLKTFYYYSKSFKLTSNTIQALKENNFENIYTSQETLSVQQNQASVSNYFAIAKSLNYTYLIDDNLNVTSIPIVSKSIIFYKDFAIFLGVSRINSQLQNSLAVIYDIVNSSRTVLGNNLTYSGEVYAARSPSNLYIIIGNYVVDVENKNLLSITGITNTQSSILDGKILSAVIIGNGIYFKNFILRLSSISGSSITGMTDSKSIYNSSNYIASSYIGQGGQIIKHLINSNLKSDVYVNDVFVFENYNFDLFNIIGGEVWL